MQEQVQGTDYLTSLGIQVETPIDENVLTSRTAENVRFRAVQVPGSSKTYGYAFGEVDKFVKNIVAPSLKWYQEALHSRDVDVFNLGGKLDEMIAYINHLEKEKASLEYNYTIKQGLMSNETDKEVLDLLDQLRAAQAEIDVLKAQVVTAPAVATFPGVPSGAGKNALEEENERLKTDLTSLKEAYMLLEQSNSSNSEGISSEREAELLAHITSLEEYSEQIREAYEALEKEVTQSTIGLPEESFNPDQYVTIEQYQQAKQELDAAIANVTGLESQYAALETQYKEDMANYQEALTAAQNNVATGGNTVENPLDEQERQELDALRQYSSDLTTQYEELAQQYTDDVTALQAELAAGGQAVVDTGETEQLKEHISQLEAYIDDITARFQELQNDLALSSNYAEIGQLKIDLVAEQAKTARLEALLDEYEAEYEEEEEVKPAQPRLLLATEEKNIPRTDIDISKLPPGIRPEDL